MRRAIRFVDARSVSTDFTCFAGGVRGSINQTLIL
jgi:hypothetical protein